MRQKPVATALRFNAQQTPRCPFCGRRGAARPSDLGWGSLCEECAEERADIDAECELPF